MSDKNFNNPWEDPMNLSFEHSEKANPILDQLEALSNAIVQLQDTPNVSLTEVPNLLHVAKELQLNPTQTAILSLVALSTPSCDPLTEKTVIKLLSHFFNGKRAIVQQSIQSLMNDKIISRDMESETDFHLTHRYRRALHTGDINAIIALKPFGLLPFLRNFIDQVMSDHSYHPYGRMIGPSIQLTDHNLCVDRNRHLACVKYLKKKIENHPQEDIGAMLFLAVLARRVIVDEPVTLSEFFESIDKPHWEVKSFKKSEIHTESWAPLKDGYFEVSGKDLLDDDLEIAITDEGISTLLPELSADVLESLLEAKQITVPHKSPENIHPQNLIFDPSTEALLRPMHKLMQPKIRQKINQKLNPKHQGICILLYGHPGTGKTEFCLQLAKEHNMPIMEVNVANIQNKWVGESEKNARKLFKQYAKLRKQSNRECILLFNEADALFSKRVDVDSSVDAMNNALKNIFLEEMEQFNGVLMATTNLTGNLDPAFERRFLFKVRFDRPTPETTAKIWQQYFKGMNADDGKNLAHRFDFSPGEISNIQRKYIIEKALGNTSKRFDLILSLAGNEKIQSSPRNGQKAMGF